MRKRLSNSLLQKLGCRETVRMQISSLMKKCSLCSTRPFTCFNNRFDDFDDFDLSLMKWDWSILQPPQQLSSRKQRRCWSLDLHRRFVNALQHVGDTQAATPKQIRELMKVDGLTNDEVKSHLQDKYMQNRLVRLVCVFLQSLIHNRIIDAYLELMVEEHSLSIVEYAKGLPLCPTFMEHSLRSL